MATFPITPSQLVIGPVDRLFITQGDSSDPPWTIVNEDETGVFQISSNGDMRFGPNGTMAFADSTSILVNLT